MNIARDGAAGTLLHDGRVLMVAGESSSPRFPTAAELYDPASGTWSITGSTIGVQRVERLTTLGDGRVLIAGGSDEDGTTLATAQIYDPATGMWSLTGSLNYPRGGDVPTLLPDGSVLIAGGSNSSGFVLPSEIYDPATGSWTSCARPMLSDCSCRAAPPGSRRPLP